MLCFIQFTSKSDPVLAKRKGVKVAVSDKSPLMSSPTLKVQNVK